MVGGTPTRHNRRDLPGDGTPTAVDIVVTETFDYAGKGGRISSVLTTNSFNDFEFLASQSYNDLGRVEDLVYPICQVSGALATVAGVDSFALTGTILP